MGYITGSNIRSTAMEIATPMSGLLPGTMPGKLLLFGGIGLAAFLLLRGKKRGGGSLIGKTLTFSGAGRGRRVRVNPKRRRRRRRR